MYEKVELLDEVEVVINKNRGLNVAYLLTVLFSIIFVLALIFPKIYIQQQIYFKRGT